MVLATNGTLITDEIARKTLESGIKRVSISIDGSNADNHDTFRGVPGAFDGSMAGIEAFKKAGVEFQINTTITRLNLDQIEDIFKLAIDLGAAAHHIFLLVPTGRAREEGKKERGKKSIIEENPLHTMTRGCMGGSSFCFISHTGQVQPCGFLEVDCGQIKEKNFEDIWNNSPVFSDLRDLRLYKGKCGRCEFIRVCGGCRARAYEITGDYLAEEPFCVYEPATRNPKPETRNY